MPIVRGSRLGPYEIAAPLGAGGMGEVYRAVDARLGREVAIKVLPAELSADAARLSRFENEARAASPVWSPDGSFIVYSEARAGALARIRGVRPDGTPIPLPEAWVLYTGSRYRFLPDGRALGIMQGAAARQDFSLLDLKTGQLRQLTNLRPLFDIKSFDVSPDGKQIVFDRFRQNSDVVLIDLPR